MNLIDRSGTFFDLHVVDSTAPVTLASRLAAQ
jgi:hypothetical protein